MSYNERKLSRRVHVSRLLTTTYDIRSGFMRLMIKQRVFAWTDTYDIYDEWGNKKYFVKSEAFRLTHQVHVYDIAGNEIGLIRDYSHSCLHLTSVWVADRVEVSGRNLHSSSHRTVLSMVDGSVMEISFRGITVSQLEAGWWQI